MKRNLFGIVAGFLMAGGFVSVAERVLFAQSPRYPAWLATGTIQTLAPESLAQLRASSCRSHPDLWVWEKPQQYLVRCGDWWPESKTWIVPRTSKNTAILQDRAVF